MLDIENSRLNQDQNPQLIAQLRERVSRALCRCQGEEPDDENVGLRDTMWKSWLPEADAAIAEVLAVLAETPISRELMHKAWANFSDDGLRENDFNDLRVAGYLALIKQLQCLHTKEESK